MMTDCEIIQMIVGIALWLLTWELFLGQFFYTNSEKEIMIRARGEGRFTLPTLVSTIITLSIMAIVFFKIVKYF